MLRQGKVRCSEYLGSTETNNRKPRESRYSILSDILKNGTSTEKKLIERLISNRKASRELVAAVTKRCKLSDRIESLKSQLLNDGTFTEEQLNEIVSDTEKNCKEKKEKKEKSKKDENIHSKKSK